MEKYCLLLLAVIGLAALGSKSSAEKAPAELRFKDDFLRRLAASVPDILKTRDPKTGRFGTGVWIVGDQHPIYPLAVAWATKSDDNPYYHDPKVLDAIMAGGDALAEDADATGQWVFRKKDASTWGMIHQPWTYSRWIRTFALIRDGMPPDRRKKWEDALILGYDNIAKKAMRRVHNIPTYHAAGLYIAGQVFDRPEWREQAKEFMAKVVAAQDPAGSWSENYGPVVSYNFVYVEGLGIYYTASGDASVLPALERAARFHANFTYPDGSRVETVDERNPYHYGITLGDLGFCFTPEGRGFLAHQWGLLRRAKKPISSDGLAGFLTHGLEGSIAPTAADVGDRIFRLEGGKALIRRKGPWFICLSAYHCPIRESRWIQDRQNLVSIFHDRRGVILGGGNTKLQPLWSNFTVGDVSLLRHKPGDQSPDFKPKGPLFHIPSAAGLKKSDPPGLGLVYGGEKCSIEVEPVDDSHLRIRLRATSKSGLPVAAHLTLMPRLGKPIRTERAPERVLGEDGFTLTSEEIGGWIAHAGWKLSLPEGSSVTWPVLPHNPYRKDGRATPAEGRIVVSIPFSPDVREHVVTLSITD